MTYAAITGWGKCLPPAVLSNADLATFLDTSDEWITSRTGIKERRISHVPLGDLAYVSSMRALAAAGLDPAAVELIVMGSCSVDDLVPNQASGLQVRLGARRAGAMDVNTACTSFLYSLSSANAMVRTGVVRNALVLGGELISAFMEWENRGVSVLFGDGCAAVVIEATESAEGLLAEKLGCDSDARDTLVIEGMGARYAHTGRVYGDTAVGVRGPGDLQARSARDGRRLQRRPRDAGGAAGRYRTRDPAPGEPPDHRGGREARRRRYGSRVRQRTEATATCRPRPCPWHWSKRWRKAACHPARCCSCLRSAPGSPGVRISYAGANALLRRGCPMRSSRPPSRPHSR